MQCPGKGEQANQGMWKSSVQFREARVAINSPNCKGSNGLQGGKAGKESAKVTIDLYSLFFPEGALEFIFNAPCLT